MRVFVSHASKERAWAEWVAWHLRAAGYTVEIDLDWRRGSSFMAKMRQALQECDAMVALYSPAYFAEGSYALMELDAWLARPQREAGLVPLRVAECEVPHLYGPYLWADLFGLGDEAAQEVLLRAVPPLPAEAAVRPRTPGEDAGPRVPGGALPAVWSVPARNPDFVGRDDLLISLRERLAAGSRAVVQALHGWGGVGKTSLANRVRPPVRWRVRPRLVDRCREARAHRRPSEDSRGRRVGGAGRHRHSGGGGEDQGPPAAPPALAADLRQPSTNRPSPAAAASSATTTPTPSTAPTTSPTP